MRGVTGIVVATVAATFYAAPAQALPDDPFDLASGIADWFDNLTTRWNKVVTKEERKQLVRYTDGLRAQIYPLISDTSMLLADIQDDRPSPEGLKRLRRQIAVLQERVQKLREQAKIIGPKIGITSAEAATLLDESLRTRGLTLSFLDKEFKLAQSDPAYWRPVILRTRLSAALVKLARAQSSITSFRNMLDRKE